MTVSWRSWRLNTVNCLVIGSAIALLGDFSVAQITSDSTLGNESSNITSTSTVDRIDGGATRGANLFHSFQEFNISEGRAAYFTNPAGIENILSRVTGDNASEIQGKLGVLGNANLFLINPHGIIFGANASLDIRGSFLASTASSIKFADGKQFSATAPQTTPLLTVSVPFGLQLETNNPGAIANAGNLAVGQNLALVAGKLDIQSGQLQAEKNLTLQASDTIRLIDSAAHPLIVKAGDRLTIQGDRAIDIFALNHPASSFSSGKDMVLRSASTVAGDGYYTTRGSFRIEQLDGSLGSLSSPQDPIIRASGDVSLNNYTGASLHILAGGSVTIPGNVTITNTDTSTNSIIENVTLSDGTTVVTINGNTQPTLDIRAGTNAFGSTESLSNATSADITIGSINNAGGTVFLTNQYNPNTLLSGGAIQVGAIDISLISGNAGSLTIDSRDRLNLNDTLNTTVATNGDGGIVNLKAENDIITKDIITWVGFRGIGNGGSISLTSEKGAIDTTAGRLDTGVTFGNGGAIALQAQGDITTAELRTSKLVQDAGIGAGGDISLISTQGRIDTTAGSLYSFSDNGDSGAVNLKAQNDIITKDIITYVGYRGVGNSGNISLTSTSGAIDTTAGKLDAGTTFGNGGDISLQARNNITTGDLLSYVVTEGRGEGGNIYLISMQGAIDTEAGTLYSSSENGNGGEIALNAAKDITTSNAQSLSRTNGDGGNISLTSTEGAIDTKAGSLNSTARDGTSGAVTLESGGKIAVGKVEANSESNGGTVTLKAQGDIIATGDLLTLAIKPETEDIDKPIDTGISGNIFLSSTTGAIDTSKSSLDAGTNLKNGGSITINAYKDITTGDLRSYVVGSGRGNGGDISLNSTIGTIDTTLGIINSYSDSDGTAGNITLNAAGNIILGDIQTGPVGIESGGAGGDINITSDADIYISNSRISAITRGFRPGGNININARSLFATKGAEIITSTFGAGTAGNVIINTSDRVSLDGGQEFVTLESQGAIPGGSRFLRRANGKVNLARNPSTDTRWSIDEGSNGVVTLKSQSSTSGPRFLYQVADKLVRLEKVFGILKKQ